MRTRIHLNVKFLPPGVQDFDHLVLGLSPQPCVQLEALEEPPQMHRHHFAR
ncbi:hypothetical protein SLEP1_g25337 [Rubroshorea leprosula]|nr:hypothetical protein SLEP1_g25337 [Rubroshorea leprosula]